MCYPVQHAHPPLRVAGVEHRIEGETVTLHFKSETHKLNLEHFKKLVTKHNKSTKNHGCVADSTTNVAPLLSGTALSSERVGRPAVRLLSLSNLLHVASLSNPVRAR